MSDATRTTTHAPDDPTKTGGVQTSADGPDLSFLSPPREPGHLGRLDHFEILSVVGRGGMGVVLRAHDDSLDRVVAIKVLAPQYAANDGARKRFIREAKAIAAVAHENVVAVHEVNEQVPFLVMQLVAGVSLQDRIDTVGPLPTIEVVRIGGQIAAGLAAAHARGIVHRDIKPSNILLEDGSERVKITDFGLARAVDDASATQAGVIAGTPMYMSPEQARGEAVDPRSDLFSLGSVLYAMSAGRAPFQATGTMATLKRVIEDDPESPRGVNPNVPDWLGAIILKLLAKNPADRFATAGEVADLLGRHLAHVQQPDREPMPARVAAPVPPRRRRWPRRVLAATTLVLVAAVVVGALLVRKYGADAIARRLANRASVRVELWDPNLQRVVVKKGETPVATLTSGETRTDLPPGEYRLELIGAPGYRPVQVTYDTSGLGPTMHIFAQATDGHYGMILYRGDEFRVFAVMRPEVRDAPAKPSVLTPPTVLASMGGTWATEMTRRPEPGKSEGLKDVGRAMVEPVAGGRYHRMYTKGTGQHGMLILGFDKDKWDFTAWYFDARGFAFGSIVGRFDAETQTLTMTQLRPDQVQSVTQHHWKDADTIHTTTTSRDQKGVVRFDGGGTWRRDPGGGPLDETTAGTGPVPKPMAVLHRIVGTWDTEMTSRLQPGTKWRAEMTGGRTLGGRFVELRERVLPTGEEHYTLCTYDPQKATFRHWYFSSRWPPAEGTAAWDEANRNLSWAWQGAGHSTTLVWKFATDDRIEFRLTVKDAAGKVLEDMEGTHTRRTVSK
jgi:hypothetical protein